MATQKISRTAAGAQKSAHKLLHITLNCPLVDSCYVYREQGKDLILCGKRRDCNMMASRK